MALWQMSGKKWIIVAVPLLIFAAPYFAIKINHYIVDHSGKERSPQEIRQEALKAGFQSNPQSLDELLALYPPSQRPTLDLIRLGKELYFDPILSRENSISCAGCHILEEGGDDNRPTAIGYKNRPNPFHINSPTVLNAALEQFQFWDGRVHTLEEQAAGPMTAPFEMAMTPGEIVEKVEENPHYRKEFQRLFQDGVTFENVEKAIAAYERTLLTRSRFDDFLDGNLTALTRKEQEGLELFLDVGCKACHFGRSVGGQIIQRFPIESYANFFYPQFGFKNGHYIFRQIVFQEPDFRPFPFDNIGGFLGRDQAQRFKVPVLREVARTAPYFHNGSIKDLKKVVEIMGKYQRGVDLNESQIDKITSFLKALSGRVGGLRNLELHRR